MNRELRRAMQREARKAKPNRAQGNLMGNPVASALIKTQILKDIQSIQTDAMLHALIGANDTKLVDNAGRVAYIAAESARLCRIDKGSNEPDMRIIAGMANALYELATNTGDKAMHRLSITSGLHACQRLITQCIPWAIGLAALKVDEIIQKTQGLTVAHITQPSPE